MERLTIIKGNLTTGSGNKLPTAEEYLGVWDFFDEATHRKCDQINQSFSSQILPLIPEMYNEAKLTQDLIQRLKSLNLFQEIWEDKGDHTKRALRTAATIMELAKLDASIATFFWLQLVVNMHTIESLGKIKFSKSQTK